MSSSPHPLGGDEAAAAATAAAAKAAEFYREVWSLLGVAFFVIVLRTYGRMRSLGFRGLQADDYMVWLALTFYSAESALAYLVGALAHGLANNGMTDAQRAALSPDSEEYRMRVTGSIIQLCGWTCYSIVLWMLKATLLMLYRRLTEGLSRAYTLRITIGFFLVGCTWAAVTLNLFLSCRPLSRMWQINPDPGNLCQPAMSNQIIWVYYAFNVSTDLYLLSIPLPLLWGSRLRTLKKVGLVFLFGGGIFVVICATLRCVYIVTDPVNGAQLAGSWAVRETFVAMVTTNLPLVFPVIRIWAGPLLEPIISSVKSSRRNNKNNNGTSGATPRHPSAGNPNAVRTFGSGGLHPQGWRGRGPPTPNPIPDLSFNESDERIAHGEANTELRDASVWAANGSAARDDVGRASPDVDNDADQSLFDAANTSIIHKSVEVNIVRHSRSEDDGLRPLTPDDEPWAQRTHVASASGPDRRSSR